MKIKQPLRIKFNGARYIRVKKHTDHGNGISEGPWYIHDKGSIASHPRITMAQDVWLPDLAFTTGASKTVTTMHYLPGVMST